MPAVLAGCVLLFCRTSCSKFDCLPRIEYIGDGTVQMQNPAAVYAIGDTIRLVQDIPYATFNGLPLQTAELRRLQGNMSFYFIKIVDSLAKGVNAVPVNGVFKGVANVGGLNAAAPANGIDLFYVSFLQDSLNSRLLSQAAFTGSEAGTYAMVLHSRFFNLNDTPCEGNYDIRQKLVWQQPINQQLVQSLLIGGKIKYRNGANGTIDLDPKEFPMLFFQLR